MGIFKKVKETKIFRKLNKVVAFVAFAVSARFNLIQNDDNFINHNPSINSNYSLTETDFDSISQKYNSNVNNNYSNESRVELGSGKTIAFSKFNNSTALNTLENTVLKLRAGQNEEEIDKLIESIISKVSESASDRPSINKLVRKFLEISVEIGANNDLMRILTEFEKPEPQIIELTMSKAALTSSFIPAYDSKSSLGPESLFDTTKCFNHRDVSQTPRTVSENFANTAVERVVEKALQNDSVKKDYLSVQEAIKAGTHPVTITPKSTFVSADKVLVKKYKGRILMQVSDTHVDTLCVGDKSNTKNMKQFGKLMNEIYDLKLKGKDYN